MPPLTMWRKRYAPLCSGMVHGGGLDAVAQGVEEEYELEQTFLPVALFIRKFEVPDFKEQWNAVSGLPDL